MDFKKTFMGSVVAALTLVSAVTFAAKKDIRDYPAVALMPFGNKAIISRELNSSGMLGVASEYVTYQLLCCQRFDPVDYEQVGAALKMLQAGQSGLYDTSTTSDVGKFIGAQYMIVGNVTGLTLKESGASMSQARTGGLGFNKHTVTANVTLRAVDVETLRIVAAGMGTGSSASSNLEVKFPLYRKQPQNQRLTVMDLLLGRKEEEKNLSVQIGTAKVSDIQVVNAINKAAWQAMYGKMGLITFLDGGKMMKNPPPVGI